MDVLLVTDKWDTYTIGNDRGVEWAALDLVRKRLEDGFWYDNWDDGNPQNQWKERAEQIVKDEDVSAALDFLDERCDFEYEYIEVQEVRGV